MANRPRLVSSNLPWLVTLTLTLIVLVRIAAVSRMSPHTSVLILNEIDIPATTLAILIASVDFLAYLAFLLTLLLMRDAKDSGKDRGDPEGADDGSLLLPFALVLGLIVVLIVSFITVLLTALVIDTAVNGPASNWIRRVLRRRGRRRPPLKRQEREAHEQRREFDSEQRIALWAFFALATLGVISTLFVTVPWMPPEQFTLTSDKTAVGYELSREDDALVVLDGIDREVLRLRLEEIEGRSYCAPRSLLEDWARRYEKWSQSLMQLLLEEPYNYPKCKVSKGF